MIQALPLLPLHPPISAHSEQNNSKALTGATATINKLRRTIINSRGGNAIYLFAGPKRKSEIGGMLKRFGWKVQEVDILRGGKLHDLSLGKVQNLMLKDIQDRKFDLMLISPPCDTFTRVKFANAWGPRPLRSMLHPHGFDYLNSAEMHKVQLADILVDFSCKAMEVHLSSPSSMLVLEFPEDLGAITHGPWEGTRPASIFQLEGFQNIMKSPGVETGVVLQSDFGMPYPKPTRLILKLRGHRIRNFHPGFSTFAPDGRYAGPAPRVSTGFGLAKTSQSEGFKTTGTAAWPTELCRELVRCINLGFREPPPVNNGLAEGSFITIDSPDDSFLSLPAETLGTNCPYPIESPPEGYWSGGQGPPRCTIIFGKEEAFFDGCGLTSPGRWARRQRRFPMDKCWEQIRHQLDSIIGNDETVILKQMAALACHREDLFCKNWIEQTRTAIHHWLGRQCGSYNAAIPPSAEEGQPFYLDMIHGLLREARDADFELYSYLGKGVTLGVEKPLPHVPALYELQTTWRLQDDNTIAAALENCNYTSVESFEQQVRDQFIEEESAGWMGRLSESEFKKTFKGRYAISALAVLQEVGKIRVLHDGSNGTRVNHRIRCRDKQRMPTLREKRTLLDEYRDDRAIAFSILADASKAHRRIKISESEWGYQACRISGDEVWYNKVGTFGMASASYWWGRAAGGIIRCAYLLNGPERHFDCLLYADDTEFLAMNRSERKSVLRAIVTLWALGWPFKWTKFRGGHEVEWVGYAVHYAEYKLGISVTRSRWVKSWTDKLLAEGRVLTAEMRCGLGRLGFVAQALVYEKPMLGIVYTWVASLCAAGTVLADIPLAVRLVLSWIGKRVEQEEGRMQVVHRRTQTVTTTDWFRTDARVENNRAYVGGWEITDSQGTVHTTATARWFGGEILPQDAPWVWAKKGDAQRSIAALELLGTILAIVLFDPDARRYSVTTCGITGGTDNKGNSYIVSKMLSTKFPITPLVIELSEQLRYRCAELYLTWIPRENNQEADDLSNLKFDDFSPDKRINFTVSGIPWKVFTELILATREMFDLINGQREQQRLRKRKTPHLGKLKGGKKLKWTDPW